MESRVRLALGLAVIGAVKFARARPATSGKVISEFRVSKVTNDRLPVNENKDDRQIGPEFYGVAATMTRTMICFSAGDRVNATDFRSRSIVFQHSD